MKRSLQFWLVAAGVLFLLLAYFLPVNAIVARAIPQSVVQEIMARGQPERVKQLQDQFTVSLGWFRFAAGIAGGWLLLLGGLASRLSPLLTAEAIDLRPPTTVDVFPAPCNAVTLQPCHRTEWLYPALWFFIAMVLGWPLLNKGFEHSELLNHEMLAKRGPLTVMACQNSPPRMAQPAATLLQSVFIRFAGANEVTARIPATASAALVFFPLYFIARRLGGPGFSNLVCLALSVNGFFLFYATYARGYALAMTSYAFCLWLALRVLERDRYGDWVLLGSGMLVSAYAHMASGLYLACVGGAVVLVRLHIVWPGRGRPGRFPPAFLLAVLKPALVFITAALAAFVLYSFGIPMELRYVKTFDLTNYYQSYHINLRFLRVMTDLFAQMRGTPWLAWTECGLFVAGCGLLIRRHTYVAAVLLAPILAGAGMMWVKNLFVYPRFFYHFLPLYVLLALYGAVRVCIGDHLFLWRAACGATVRSLTGHRWADAVGRGCQTRRTPDQGHGAAGLAAPPYRCRLVISLLALCLLFVAPASLCRLYRMERCGVRTAVHDYQTLREPGDRVMGVLDGYVTVHYYQREAVKGYSGSEFTEQLQKPQPPEYIISVPYIDYDIPGGRAAIEAQYKLVHVYPSWLDVDDDQDSVYLYARKDRSMKPDGTGE